MTITSTSAIKIPPTTIATTYGTIPGGVQKTVLLFNYLINKFKFVKV